MTVDTLLSRLQKVRARGKDQWTACCPAHPDKTPSLSIRELPDGRVLVKDFGGCELTAVLDAVGLQVKDLYPEHVPGTEPDRREARRGFDARVVLESVAFETTVVLVAIGRIQRKGYLNDEEIERRQKLYDKQERGQVANPSREQAELAQFGKAGTTETLIDKLVQLEAEPLEEEPGLGGLD